MKSRKNILVVGTIRNGEKKLKNDIERLQDALGFADRLQWLLVESDSEDATQRVLAELTEEVADFRYLKMGNLAEQESRRTVRLAMCRNAYLRELNGNPIYKEVNYVVMADLDGVNRLISEKSVLSCFEREGWGACMANQDGHYYDVWALRHAVWSPNDCLEQEIFLRQFGVAEHRAKYAAIFSKMIVVPQDVDWIEVESAFGGFAIYRREVLQDVEYIGETEAGEEICEHVRLHAQIRARGHRLFINPRMINAGKTQHTKYFIWHKRVLRRFKLMLKNWKRLVGAN